MIKIIYILNIFFFLGINMQSAKLDQEECDCEFKVLYSQDIKKIEDHKRDDSLRLILTGAFEATDFKVKVNNKPFVTDKLTTSAVMGYAEVYNVGHINQINNLNIKVGECKPYNLPKVNPEFQFIVIGKINESNNKIIIVEHLRRFPQFE